MKAKVRLGPLIEGTMRPVDTIPAMLNEVVRRGKDPWPIVSAANEEWLDSSIHLAAALWHVSKDDPNPLRYPMGFSANEKHRWWTEDVDNSQGWTNHQENQQVWQELVDLLNEDLAGATFGTHPNDPACLGYWAEPNEDTRGEGVGFEWEDVGHGGLVLRHKLAPEGQDVFLQGDDKAKFQQEIGAVDFVWMNDPKNEKGRVFKTIEEHYDAIMDPYFGNQ